MAGEMVFPSIVKLNELEIAIALGKASSLSFCVLRYIIVGPGVGKLGKSAQDIVGRTKFVTKPALALIAGMLKLVLVNPEGE